MRVEGNRWREHGPYVAGGEGVVDEDLGAHADPRGCRLDQMEAGGTR
jgi:hypothetical protein